MDCCFWRYSHWLLSAFMSHQRILAVSSKSSMIAWLLDWNPLKSSNLRPTPEWFHSFRYSARYTAATAINSSAPVNLFSSSFSWKRMISFLNISMEQSTMLVSYSLSVIFNHRQYDEQQLQHLGYSDALLSN